MARRNRRRSSSAATPSSRGQRTVEPDATTPTRFKFAIVLSIITLVALLLRLLHIGQTLQVPTVITLIGDSRGYYDWAVRIADGNWYGTETFYQAPLYPYFLAVLKTLGADVTGMRVVQALLGTASVLLIGVAARTVFSNRVGLIAAAILAIYPPAIYYDGIIQKTSLASFLLCALLCACTLLQHRRKIWIAVATGVFLGLLVITRENALLWIPLFPFWMLLGFGAPRLRANSADSPSDDSQSSLPSGLEQACQESGIAVASVPTQSLQGRVVLTVAFLIGLAAILLPIAARNASLGGEWSPTTFQAGPNFYIGNNLNANGVYRPLVPGHETPLYERADAQRLAEEAEGRTLSAREVSRHWMARAFDEIRQAPGQWLELMALKSLMVINRFEVPDVESMVVYAEFSAPLKWFGWALHFGWLCPLAVWGTVVSARHWRALWFYHLLILVMMAAVVLFFIMGRYRHPLVPLLIPLAAVGVVSIYQIVRSRDWMTALRPAIASTVAAVVCHLPVHDESMLNASCFMNLGVSAGQAGDMGTCMRWLKYAIAEHPEMPEAHVNLARAYSLSGNPQQAIKSYRQALRLDPNLVSVDFYLAKTLEQVGDRAAALTHYRRAVEIDPQDQESLAAIRRLSGAGP